MNSRIHEEQEILEKGRAEETLQNEHFDRERRAASNAALNVPLSVEDRRIAQEASFEQRQANHLSNASKDSEAGRLHIRACLLEQRVLKDGWGIDKKSRAELDSINNQLSRLEPPIRTAPTEERELSYEYDEEYHTDETAEEISDWFDKETERISGVPREPESLSLPEWQRLPYNERLEKMHKIEKNTSKGSW